MLLALLGRLAGGLSKSALVAGLALPAVVLAQDEDPAPEPASALMPAMPAPGVRSCAMVVAGFDKPGVDILTARAWEEMTRFVSNSLYEVLDKQEHVAVQKTFVEQSLSDRVPPAWLRPFAKSRCTEVITVVNGLGGDAQGPFVLFDFVAYHFARNPANGEMVTVNDFKKAYRYSRDAATVGSLSALTISRAAVADMRAAGVLDGFRTASPPADKQQVLKAYSTMLAKWNLNEYHVRRILLPDEASARAALARIRGGEPFAEVAKALSIDHWSGNQGGDLLWALPSSYEPALARAIAKDKAGGLIAEPVHGETGWNVVEVLAVRPLPPPPFEDVQLRIDERLRLLRDEKAASAAR
jgi:hypothetical protein